MRDYLLMSDIRTKILLGTTISAVSVMLVMAVGMASVQANTPTETLGLAGHFEVVVNNPDGTTYYSQGDNVVVGAGKQAVGDELFDGTAVTSAGQFLCTILGTGTFSATGENLAGALGNTLVACDGDASGNCNNAGSATTSEVCTIVTSAIIDDDTGTDECSPACELTEVRLEVSGGTVFSQTALATNVFASTDATVVTTYTMTIG